MSTTHTLASIHDTINDTLADAMTDEGVREGYAGGTLMISVILTDGRVISVTEDDAPFSPIVGADDDVVTIDGFGVSVYTDLNAYDYGDTALIGTTGPTLKHLRVALRAIKP